MPVPILADFDFERNAKILGFFVAVVTLGYGTLTFLKLWRERKLAITDYFVGRWEWTLDGQVLEVVFKPDGTWEGRIVANRGIIGSLVGLFSGGRIGGTWFIATSAGRTINIREAGGKWHVEDRIRKIKKNRILLAAKGELIRIPAAADLVAEEAPPPLPPTASPSA